VVPKSVKKRLAKADEAFEDGHVASALRIVDEILDEDPEDLDARMNRAIYRTASDPNGALADLDFIVARDDDHIDARMQRSLIFITQKAWAAAEGACNSVLAIDPHNADAVTNLGTCALGRKDYPSARQYFERSIDLDDGNADGHCGLAEAFVALRDFDRALSSLSRAMELDPDYVRYAQTEDSFSALRKDARFAELLVPKKRGRRTVKKDPGCHVCKSSSLGHYMGTDLLADSHSGLEKVSPRTPDNGWDYDALYVCKSCSAYRRLGAVERSKDYHAVWLEIARASDLEPFMNEIRALAERSGRSTEAMVAEIIERSVVEIES
jgi:tetratricopeptide (TPR) repeat protein